jgi:hypothetical protein
MRTRLVSQQDETLASGHELVRRVDPWRLRLERVGGTTGFDGLERAGKSNPRVPASESKITANSRLAGELRCI